MTIRDAIDLLHGRKLYMSMGFLSNEAEWVKSNNEAIDMAIAALEQQEGKMPKEARNIYPPEQFECPVCGCCVGRHKTLRKVNDLLGEVLTDCKVEFNFCPDCGQKILWE